MNIGFISTWFERGAAYVTKAYIDALKNSHNVFVYARGGEYFSKKDPNWGQNYVTWGLRLGGTNICWRHFKKWVISKKLDILFFNEQKDTELLPQLKLELPNLKLGSYVDYYKMNTIQDFDLFDFLICNTKRHYSIFNKHPQCFYVPWGTNIDLFKPKSRKKWKKELIFFHSAGLSARKGTDLLVEAFIEGELHKVSRLVIHTQADMKSTYNLDPKELEKYNIEVIQKTVSAPGLYYLGDVYVYPTYLEGLGLTIYEALSSGLPVIITDYSPMNEVINNEIGKLIRVEKIFSREDGYYWPLTVCDKAELIRAMKYYHENYPQINSLKEKARNYACQNLDWSQQFKKVQEIFENVVILTRNKQELQRIKKQYKSRKKRNWSRAIIENIPFCSLKHAIWTIHEKRKRKTST